MANCFKVRIMALKQDISDQDKCQVSIRSIPACNVSVMALPDSDVSLNNKCKIAFKPLELCQYSVKELLLCSLRISSVCTIDDTVEWILADILGLEITDIYGNNIIIKI